MAMAITLQEYLDWENIDYDLVQHNHTATTLQAAHAAHVPANETAKCVVLGDDYGYLMVVVPATRKVDIEALKETFNRDLELANEDELNDLFYDCEKGAIPPLCEAYGFDVVMDDSLMDCKEIYFESGDHVDLVHIHGHDFRQLMSNVVSGEFSYAG